MYGIYDVTCVWVLCNFDFSSIHEVSNFGSDSLLGLWDLLLGLLVWFGIGDWDLVWDLEIWYVSTK